MELDFLFEDAARLTVKFGMGSPAHLEQRLKISTQQSFILLDQMQQAGIVGPFRLNGLRELYVRDEKDLDSILDTLNEAWS